MLITCKITVQLEFSLIVYCCFGVMVAIVHPFGLHYRRYHDLPEFAVLEDLDFTSTTAWMD